MCRIKVQTGIVIKGYGEAHKINTYKNVGEKRASHFHTQIRNTLINVIQKLAWIGCTKQWLLQPHNVYA